MADRFEGIKHLVEVAFGSMTATTTSRLRGKDFMNHDLTYGADRA